MFLTAFEPGREMAIANFFLAVFCLFTIALPLLLITRGDKTKANRDFLVATVNAWSQLYKNSKLSPVIISEVTSSIKPELNLELVSENNTTPIPESREVISLEIKVSNDFDESSTQLLPTDDELLTA